jgi:hypothetical protein
VLWLYLSVQCLLAAHLLIFWNTDVCVCVYVCMISNFCSNQWNIIKLKFLSTEQIVILRTLTIYYIKKYIYKPPKYCISLPMPYSVQKMPFLFTLSSNVTERDYHHIQSPTMTYSTRLLQSHNHDLLDFSLVYSLIHSFIFVPSIYTRPYGLQILNKSTIIINMHTAYESTIHE